MKHIRLFEGFALNESTYSRMAQTSEQEDAIVTIERWLKKMGKNVVGGTTIGKHPQTVILDLAYQGSEIYVGTNGFEDTDGGYPGVKVSGTHVESEDDFDTFKEAVEKK